MTPILILTRPSIDKNTFAQAVMREVGRDMPMIASPALQIVPLQVETTPQADQVIFTSANAVPQAGRLGMTARTAWCVGDKTAFAARAAGYKAFSAQGTADDLVALITKVRPTGRLVHVSGRHTRGDIAARVQKEGISCETIATYDQIVLPPSSELKLAAEGQAPLIIPIFSPRSAKMLETLEGPAPRYIVAISAAVMAKGQVTVADAPTQDAMVAATVATILQVWPGGI